MTSSGSPLIRLRHSLAAHDLLTARLAASELRTVQLDDAALLVALIARDDPDHFGQAAVRFLGRLSLERKLPLPTLADAARCLHELGRSPDARERFADVCERLALPHAATQLRDTQGRPHGARGDRWPRGEIVDRE